LNTNSTGSSIVKICSHLSSFILSKIATIEVDLPDQVGQVIKIKPCFNLVKTLTAGGNHNCSIFIALLAILLKTKEIFHNL
jgi:hypothetical protein